MWNCVITISDSVTKFKSIDNQENKALQDFSSY